MYIHWRITFISYPESKYLFVGIIWCNSQSWNHPNCVSMEVCLHFKNTFFHCSCKSNFCSTFQQHLAWPQIWPVLTILICFLFVLWSILLYQLFHCQLYAVPNFIYSAIIPSYTKKFVFTCGNWLLNSLKLKKKKKNPFEFISGFSKRNTICKPSPIAYSFLSSYDINIVVYVFRHKLIYRWWCTLDTHYLIVF